MMLRLEDVRVRIQEQLVLRGVGMAIERARTTVLIGRNGAGKTTTLRSIMGLLPLEGGRILFDDIDLSTVASHHRAMLGIGYAPEDRRLICEFSVEDNILLPAIALRLPLGERRRRLDEIYALLPEVAELRQRPAGVLSGGRRRTGRSRPEMVLAAVQSIFRRSENRFAAENATTQGLLERIPILLKRTSL